jgi:hypothetical protein
MAFDVARALDEREQVGVDDLVDWTMPSRPRPLHYGVARYQGIGHHQAALRGGAGRCTREVSPCHGPGDRKLGAPTLNGQQAAYIESPTKGSRLACCKASMPAE